MYLPTNYVTPQYNASPESGLVIPPNGWGIQYTNPAAPKKSCGMGMFESMDFSTWGFAEWAAIAVGAYLVWKLMSDVSGAATKVKRTVRKRRSLAAKKEKLQEELSLL
jgi:hypothetical protein